MKNQDKLYAVSYINFMDNKLTTVFRKGTSDYEVLFSFMLEKNHFFDDFTKEEFPNIESIKQEAFNQDAMVNIVEVPVL